MATTGERDASNDALRMSWAWRVAISGLLLLFAYRTLYLFELPGVAGVDPYVRLYGRDQVELALYGRKWSPLLQFFIVTIYQAGGELAHVRWLLAGLGTAFVAVAGYYVWRSIGWVAAVAAAAWLLTDLELLWVSAAPYQELFLYLPMFVVLHHLSRSAARPGPWPSVKEAAVVAAWLVLAEFARYEGVLLLAAVAVAASLRAWRLGDRSPRRHGLLLVLLVAIPVAHYVIFTGGHGLVVDPPKYEPPELFGAATVVASTGALLGYLALDRTLALVCAALGVFAVVRDGRWRRPDLLVLTLYTLAFAATYVVASPFSPPTNRRFHVPLNLWLAVFGGVGVHALLVHVQSARLPDAACRLASTATALAIAGAALFGWRATAADLDDLLRKHRRSARIGAKIDALAREDAVILLAWPRGEFDGRPSVENLRVLGHLRGPNVRRVRFLDDYTALPHDERRALLSSAGLVAVRRERKAGDKLPTLVDDREPEADVSDDPSTGDNAARRARRAALVHSIEATLRELHGERLKRTRGPSRVFLYTHTMKPR